MRGPWIAIALAAGCGRPDARACVSCDAAPADADVLCFTGWPGDFLTNACVVRREPRTLDTQVIDTNLDGPMCEADFKAPFCMFSGTSITIPAGAVVTASGTRPLLFVSSSAITLDGTIDVSSHRGPSEVIGAAANDARCTASAGTEDPAGGGGGAGGTFQFPGGAGGAVGAAAGAQPGQAATPVSLHGGCGGATGAPFGTTAGGAAGHSGGAVYLMARGSIQIGAAALLAANGEGGGKASATAGGGGGASGGMIVFDAPVIDVASGALVLAEGGGGGGGGDPAGGAGDGGEIVTAPAAPGGVASAPAGAGGNGASAGPGGTGHDGPINPTTSTGGGGGGGGASGYVIVFGKITNHGTVSPPPTE